MLAALLQVQPARALNGQEPSPGLLADWSEQLPADDRVLTEMARFADDLEPLSETYRTNLAARVRSDIFLAADRTVAALAYSGCEPRVTVTLPALEDVEPVLPTSPAAESFENSMVRVESLTCVATEHDDPAAALSLYTSPEFRRAAESRLEEIRVQGSEICERTGGTFPILAPTGSCSLIHRLDAESLSAQHSQVVSNSGAERDQVVYFKESLKTVVRIPGGIAIHHVHYSRSVNLGRLERWVAPGKVRGAEENTLALLKQRIQASAP